MARKKKVWKMKDGEKTVEETVCHPQKMKKVSLIEDYWEDVIKTVNKYEKERGLQTTHKLFSDDRIEKGLKLYESGHIKEYDITKAEKGDVKAEVRSEDGERTYTVIIKNWKPEKLLRRRYERERYIADLYVRCECKDNLFGHYRSNSSVFCKHICAVWWFLEKEFNAPRIFVTKEEKEEGIIRANAEDVAKIEGVPMQKFANWLHVVELKEHRGKKPALSLSIHRKDHKTGEEYKKPWWVTFTEPKEVEEFMGAVEKVYRDMKDARREEEESLLDKFLGFLGFE